MKYINSEKIENILLNSKNVSYKKIDEILNKSKFLERLSLEETAILLSVQDDQNLKKIFEAAASLKNKIYGQRIVLFAPLYINNFCANNCIYCSFQSSNINLERKALAPIEIHKEVELLLKKGHKRILMVSGETAPFGKNNIDYYLECIDAIYKASYKENKIRRVNVNCAPLRVKDFKKLKKAGIGTYQLFQETYHDDTYLKVHTKGPKSDPDNRIYAIDKAFDAGIDDVGIGVLYGLYDYKFETLAMLMHVEHLEKKYGIGPHTISVPRIEPAFGSSFSNNVPYKVSDKDFKKIVAVLRLSVPYTGLILSTRETKEMRNELVDLGISQISAGSHTAPGGYSDANKDLATQFTLNDNRTLDEVIESLLQKNLIPSFCTACYRKDRTGEVFMDLAKPGTIQKKCKINALVTLKEYLDDFASYDVRMKGYKLINSLKKDLDDESKKRLTKFFKEIDKGIRDRYV